PLRLAHSFPTRRSSDLAVGVLDAVLQREDVLGGIVVDLPRLGEIALELGRALLGEVEVGEAVEDRLGDLELVQRLHHAGIEAREIGRATSELQSRENLV